MDALNNQQGAAIYLMVLRRADSYFLTDVGKLKTKTWGVRT